MVHTYITKARYALEPMGNFGLAADNVNTYKGTKDVASTVMHEVQCTVPPSSLQGLLSVAGSSDAMLACC